MPRNPHPPLPDEFLCPFTKAVLQEPIVAPNGYTYEKAALQDRNIKPLIPNINLKKIISDHPHKRSTNQFGNYPSEYNCPFSLDIMTEPVVAEDGHSYQREAISQYLSNHSRSPFTSAVLNRENLVSNWTLQKLIARDPEAQKSLESDQCFFIPDPAPLLDFVDPEPEPTHHVALEIDDSPAPAALPQQNRQQDWERARRCKTFAKILLACSPLAIIGIIVLSVVLSGGPNYNPTPPPAL